MEDRALSAYLIFSSDNLYYFTGFKGEGVAIVTADGDVMLYVPPLYYEAATIYAHQGIEIHRVRSVDMFGEELIEGLGKFVGDVGFDRIDAEFYCKLNDKLRFLRLIPSSDLVWKLRSVKDPSEIENIARAARILDTVIEIAPELITPGASEQEIKTELIEEIHRCGAEKLAFDIIVASGPRSSLPHGGLGDRVIQDGDVVVVDLGAKVNEYCADVSRTFFVGDSAPDTFKQCYKLVQDVKHAVEDAIMAWVSASSIDRLARSMMDEAGYGHYFIHSLGHGIGISVHEPPRISPNSKDILMENMTITCEPGIYIEGKFGIRLEDCLLVKKNGVMKLSKANVDPYI